MKRNEKKPLGCGICPYKTNSACHLERHLRIHTGQKPYACEICSYRATDGGLLKRHMRIHSGEKPFICHICGHKTAQSCSLKDHMAVHTGKKRYACGLCSFQCSRIGRLRDHQRVHEIKTETTQEDYVPNEAFISPNEPKYETDHVLHKCSLCSLEFSEMQYLERHVASVHSAGSAQPMLLASSSPGYEAQDSPHFCSLCATPQVSSEDLENHIALHILYKCLKCKSVFGTPDELTAHGFSHTNELLLDCNFCDFKCRTRNELRGHGRIHSTQQFKCSTCEFESKSAMEFSQHLMTHTMKEIVICNICLQKFRKTEDLRDHMVSHYTRIRTRTIRRNNELKPDRSKEDVGDSYSCFYCSFKCPRECEVEQHIIEVHVPATPSTKLSNEINESVASYRNKLENTDQNPNPEHINRSLDVSRGCLPLGHQQVDLPQISKTQQMNHRASFKYHNPSIEIPHISFWNHQSISGHFMDRHSLASSMSQCPNVSMNFDSAAIPPNCHPSLSIVQSTQTYEHLSKGGLIHNQNLYLQTIRREYRSAIGFDLKDEERSPIQEKYGTTIGIFQGCDTTRGMNCGTDRSVEEESMAERHYQKIERIVGKQRMTVVKIQTNVACDNEDSRSESETKTLNKARLKREKRQAQLSVGTRTKSLVPDGSQDLESVQMAMENVSGKGVINMVDEYDTKIGSGTSETVTRGVKRKMKPAGDGHNSKVERRVTRNATKMRTLSTTTLEDTLETPQSNSVERRKNETPEDILLSKLRKFFNDSFPKFKEAPTARNASRSAAADPAASAICTIDLSSDDDSPASN